MIASSVIYLLCILLVFGSVVYLLICVDPNAKGPIGVIRSLVLEKTPEMFKKAGSLVFGPRFGLCVDGTCTYLFKTNNPIVMFLYILVGPGGYAAYMKFGYYDNMPNDYVSSLHLYPSIVLAGLCFYWYYRAVNTDPGVITKENCRDYMLKYDRCFDGDIFIKGSVCTTCKTKK